MAYMFIQCKNASHLSINLHYHFKAYPLYLHVNLYNKSKTKRHWCTGMKYITREDKSFVIYFFGTHGLVCFTLTLCILQVFRSAEGTGIRLDSASAYLSSSSYWPSLAGSDIGLSFISDTMHVAGISKCRGHGHQTGQCLSICRWHHQSILRLIVSQGHCTFKKLWACLSQDGESLEGVQN